MPYRPRCISITDVQQAVARVFRLSIAEMMSRKRSRTVASARQVAMYLSRELTGGGGRRAGASFPRIGMAFARDHSSVIHACCVIERRRQSDGGFAQMLEAIEGELTAARTEEESKICRRPAGAWCDPTRFPEVAIESTKGRRARRR